MSIQCQLDCGENAKIYCLDCTLVKYYCQECFAMTHKVPSKSSHKTTGNFNEHKEKLKSSQCQFHPKFPKIMVCLNCDKPVCTECISSETHKGIVLEISSKGSKKLLMTQKI